MSLSGEGDNAQAVEVANTSSNGIWLYAQGKEMFMSYEDFPWFEEAAVSKILNVEEASTGHFYWAELDVDLRIDSIENPEKYPLKSS